MIVEFKACDFADGFYEATVYSSTPLFQEPFDADEYIERLAWRTPGGGSKGGAEAFDPKKYACHSHSPHASWFTASCVKCRLGPVVFPSHYNF